MLEHQAIQTPSISDSDEGSLPYPYVRANFKLNETEVKIFERLLGTLDYYKLDNEIRVAGGWVRDKLLGKNSKDMDISLEDMTGPEFAEKLRDYLFFLGEHRHRISISQSETAMMRYSGVDLDFVNLRCEDYSHNSRIPTTTKYGTPKQDAMRRDLTINSLFYNIRTKLLEDWTDRGVKDLNSGRIVTPSPPHTSFMDDPLRVLRAIRFAAKFEFMLDEQLKEAAACNEVKQALEDKISRDRIGDEIKKMIHENQPVQAMTYICDLKLFGVVFHCQCEPPDGCDSNGVAYLDSIWKLHQLVGSSTFNDKQRSLSFYAAMFLPLRKTIYKNHEGLQFPVVRYIFKDSLKLKVSDAEAVISIHNAAEKFLSLLPHLSSSGDVELADVDLGREYDDVAATSRESKLRVLTGILLHEIKDLWRVALMVSTLLYPTEGVVHHHHLNNFKLAEKAIMNLGLDEFWVVKPLVPGNYIIHDLQLKPKPVINECKRKVIAWQLTHPSGTAEECREWIKRKVKPNVV